MAYITKAEVQAKQDKLKAINKKYGVSARFSGSNSSTLRLKITKGSIDFIGNYLEVANSSRSKEINGVDFVQKERTIDVNVYWYKNHFSGVALDYLDEVYSLMCEGHYDDSDSMTDYFDCAWYNRISIGAWDAPYVQN